MVRDLACSIARARAARSGASSGASAAAESPATGRSRPQHHGSVMLLRTWCRMSPATSRARCAAGPRLLHLCCVGPQAFGRRGHRRLEARTRAGIDHVDPRHELRERLPVGSQHPTVPTSIATRFARSSSAAAFLLFTPSATSAAPAVPPIAASPEGRTHRAEARDPGEVQRRHRQADPRRPSPWDAQAQPYLPAAHSGSTRSATARPRGGCPCRRVSPARARSRPRRTRGRGSPPGRPRRAHRRRPRSRRCLRH